MKELIRMYRDEKEGKEKVKLYYKQEAKDYIKQYQRGFKEYPANLIRLNLIVDRLRKNKVRTVLDVGCGTCGPMIRLLKEGFDVSGFDFSSDMVAQGKNELKRHGYKTDLIHRADLENKENLPSAKFDAILALGVFPHILDAKKALSNARGLLKKNGLVFIQFRNDLFAAYTLNKYSLDFFLNRAIDAASLSKELGEEVSDFYSERFKVDKPVKKEDGALLYTDILAKFHNPLSIGKEMFGPCGFQVVDMHFYHYHALPLAFENKYPDLFRDLSLKMEKPNDWRGYLMASAYVVEARKID